MNKYILFILSLSIYLNADEPPDWSEFTIQSENKNWSASVQRIGELSEPWENGWVLNIYHGYYISSPASNVKPAWSVPYNHSGYSGGYLSDDGSAFSYVEFWFYRDYPVVQIYKADCTIKKNGSYFKVGNNLQQTVSHELWLKDGGEVKYTTKRGKLHLVLQTIKGESKIAAECNGKIK